MARPVTFWTAESLLARTTDDAGCLVWQGRMHTTSGAPLVDHGGQRWMARRLLLTLLGVALRPTDFVRCTCETPGCMAPEHQRVLSRRRHLADVAASPARNELLRRQRIAATRRARHAVLTPEQVRLVRESPESAAALAHRLGVSRSLTARIRRGDVWAQHSGPWAGMGRR